MASLIQFETPENVQIAYRPAGVGTRYSAWMLDSVFVALLGFVVFILTMVLMAAVRVALKHVGKFTAVNDNNLPQIPFVFMAIAWLFFGLGSFIYFTLCELFWRGQTIGKWACRIRVVKADGFSLDASSIFLRNVFRIVDQLPPLWIVPVLSVRSQRFGDMAAATLVVADPRDKLGELRTALLARPADQSKFRFDATGLALRYRSTSKRPSGFWSAGRRFPRDSGSNF